MKACIINTRESFVDLCDKGAIVGNSVILFDQMGDIHPRVPHVIFPNATTLILNRCDKNFVYYWLKQDIFPSLQHLYLGSHPCQSDLLYRWDKSHYKGKFYICTWYKHYVERWAREDTNIELIPDGDFELMVNMFESEEVRLV